MRLREGERERDDFEEGLTLRSEDMLLYVKCRVGVRNTDHIKFIIGA
jgi:hypothetical protein